MKALVALISIAFLLACILAVKLISAWDWQFLRRERSGFVTADAKGIALARHMELPAQFLSWASVVEVILARKFRIIYPTGKLKCYDVVIIFLAPEHIETMDGLNHAQSGISKSGSGRLYISADFPDGNWRAFESALDKFAPEGVKVSVFSEAIFDSKFGKDDYWSPLPE